MCEKKAEYQKNLLMEIRKMNTPMRIMEVCGTHTAAIALSGLRELLPDFLVLVSGPGCPVCVTAESEIDTACVLARQPNIILAAFGDMLRVPGTNGSLENMRLEGADIRVIYSGFEALKIAADNPAKEVVLLGIGFETTAPTTAVLIETAKLRNLMNFSVFMLQKSVPPILECLLEDKELNIDAFLLPGHVAAITGLAAFNFISDKYHRPGVVAGFEPEDILEAILILLHQHEHKKAAVTIQYRRVNEQGNLRAISYIEKYFFKAECVWRGIGSVPLSGYELKEEFSAFDARCKFSLPKVNTESTICVCRDILKGRKTPDECEFFAAACTPYTPLGPCMVSAEGSCAAYYLAQKGRQYD